MVRATTPTFELTVTGEAVDLSQAENVYVAIKQRNLTIEMTGDELSIVGNKVSCYLSQEKSLQLIEGANAKIQVNWTYLAQDGQTVLRAATCVGSIPITEQLIQRVIE